MSISLVLYDRFEGRNDLLPLVATRPIGNLRLGAFTLDQKWGFIFDTVSSYLTEEYLSKKFPLKTVSEKVLVINAAALPNKNLVKKLKNLSLNERLIDSNGDWIAFVSTVNSSEEIIQLLESDEFDNIVFEEEYSRLKYLEDIFTYNATQIEFDVELLNGLDYESISSGVYSAASAVICENVTLDSTKGSILIFDDAIIESGSVIHGPAVIGKQSRVKSGTVIYSNVTVGDKTTVGGELNNTVIWGNSAKGHYGYLGCAVIGEGCNLGAGTSNSNLKNDWNSVKLYSYQYNNFRNTGLLKCGVFIGDHSMIAISSKINTGTVIGIGSQIAMSNFIPKFVPDYSWLSDSKFDSYDIVKFLDMMRRKSDVKKESFTADDIAILEYIYKKTTGLRNY
ncbi:putative sugar nucleotidyl transferase [Sphingobacterium bovistauri]|uniref:Transferase n=1 Tax=Sphingobacterium bovistauri TaxID=2781959 RepID=A0ABS7Z6F9_9SPHI|nr:putative sugar nucleotidyl transferase [Sphingobacterium bovistauri]MCA5005775.1 transferase [Sphingobacterium bovistauri]